MIFRRSKSFNKDIDCLDKLDREAVNKNAFEEFSKALNGNAELYHKYRLKKMTGTNDFWEGHLKDNLCFVFKKHEENGDLVCTFYWIGDHSIYDRVKR